AGSGRPGSLSLPARRQRDRPHRIALAEQGAGPGDHVVALIETVADFDLAAGHQPDLDTPRLDAPALHNLHQGAGVTVLNRRQRHCATAALAGLDLRAARRIDRKPAVAGDADEGLAKLAVLFDGRRDAADLALDVARADDLDAGGLVHRKLADILGRHQADQIIF